MKLTNWFGRSTTGKVLISVLVCTAIAVPGSVWAVTTFTDVPTSHTFYKEISAVAGAGIAQGFGDGTYRPGIDITRQAMAAFMERGVGRAASHDGVAQVLDDYSQVAAVAMDAGATGAGANGFMHVSGMVFAETQAATTINCPCIVDVFLYDGDNSHAHSYLEVPRLLDGQNAIGSTSLETVIAVDGDSTHLYRLVTNASNAFGDGITATGSVTATYFPLSGDGDKTEEYDLICPKDDAWEQNDTSATAATYFMASANLTDAIACPSDEDWYGDYVLGGSTIQVDVEFTHAEGNINACLYMATTQVTCSTGVINNESITYTLAPEGNYFVRVYLAADSGSSPGNTYTLSATKSSDG